MSDGPRNPFYDSESFYAWAMFDQFSLAYYGDYGLNEDDLITIVETDFTYKQRRKIAFGALGAVKAAMMRQGFTIVKGNDAYGEYRVVKRKEY